MKIYKKKLPKVATQIGPKELLLIKNLKLLYGRHFSQKILITKKLPDVFTKKIYKKTNKKDLTIEKEIKRNVNKLYTEWKGYDNFFNRWIDKCDIAI